MTEPRFTAYEDEKGEWRWNLKAANGLKIADSGEGYKRIEDCLRGIQLVKKLAPNASVNGPEIRNHLAAAVRRRQLNSLLASGTIAGGGSR